MSTPSTSAGLCLGDHVRDLSWDASSGRFACALGNGEVAIVEATKPELRLLRQWNAHRFGTCRACLHPSAGILVTSGEDGFLRWWDTQTGSLIREHRENHWAEHLAWNRDGKLLLAGLGRRAMILDPQGASQWESSDHPSTLSAAIWRNDGRAVGLASYGRIQLFRLGEAKPYENLVHRTSFDTLAWSPNGRHVAAGSQEKSVVYWKLPFQESAPLNMHGYAHKPKSLSWDATSRWLATTGSPRSVTLWDVSGSGPRGAKPLLLQGHTADPTQVAFQHKGGTLASGCGGGAVWLWTPSRGDGGLAWARLEGEITQLGWSPNDALLAVSTSEGWVRCLS